MIKLVLSWGSGFFFFFAVEFSEQGFPEKNTLRLSEWFFSAHSALQMAFVEGEKMHYSESPSDLQENWKYQILFYHLNFPTRKSQKILFSGLR